MIRRSATYLFVAVLGLASPAVAQTPLTLAEAIARARTQNPDAGGAAAAEREAAQRVTQARAGYLPRVDVVESWQRGNQPVFAFSSLLAQRQFTTADFALGALNHPDALDNFRSAVMVEQSLFDGATRANVTAAGIGHDMATTSRTMVDHDLAASVTNAYGRVLVAAAASQSAAAAADTARADRELAGNRRDAGLVTDADVLQLDVYVSRTREQQIRATSDERIARAQLNQLMGEPLGEAFVLDRSPTASVIDATDLASLEAEALKNRPDVKLAALQEQLADATQRAARAAFLPQVAAQGAWEFNGGAWNRRTSGWVVGAVARINVFHGFADTARLAEAREQTTRRALERDKAETAARLDVYIAVARPSGYAVLSTPGVPDLRTAPPADFGGPGDAWSPEHLLLAAVQTCVLLTLRSIARASHVDFISLDLDAAGTVDRQEGVTRFTEIVLRPRLVIARGTDRERALRMLEKSEKHCLVSASLSTPIRVEPEIMES